MGENRFEIKLTPRSKTFKELTDRGVANALIAALVMDILNEVAQRTIPILAKNAGPIDNIPDTDRRRDFDPKRPTMAGDAAATQPATLGHLEARSGFPHGLRLPAMPNDGTSFCSITTSCRCSWDVQVRGDGWDCTWTLGQADHCPTCLDRAKMWAPLRIESPVARSTSSAQGLLGAVAKRLGSQFLADLK